ncbi:Plasmodesmata Callose-binding protein 5, partial [Mucuna pruriens]
MYPSVLQLQKHSLSISFIIHSLIASNAITAYTLSLSVSSISLLKHFSNGHISTTPITQPFESPTQPISLSSSSSLTDHSPRMPTSQSFVLSLLFLLGLSPFCGGDSGGVPPQELWCVAKNNAEDASLQAALDWACGAGGADCGPIQRGGACYDPSSVQNTASFAFNDYFTKNGMTDDSCNFNNNAAVTSLNPSHDNCKFPSGDQWEFFWINTIFICWIGTESRFEWVHESLLGVVLAFEYYRSFDVHGFCFWMM